VDHRREAARGRVCLTKRTLALATREGCRRPDTPQSSDEGSDLEFILQEEEGGGVFQDRLVLGLFWVLRGWRSLLRGLRALFGRGAWCREAPLRRRFL
jgi:hypothetical protein